MTGSFAPIWMAQESGAFAAHGLNVDLSLVETVASLAALVSGELDAVEISAGPIISADASGTGLVFIASGLNHPIFSLVTKPNIHSGADLAGKVVASGVTGNPVDFGTKQLLSLLGVQPSSVSILPLAASGTLTALLAGQADAATLAPPNTFTAQDAGFQVLENDYDQPYQNIGLVVRQSRIAAIRPALVALLAAYRDGITAYNNDPDLAIQTFQKYSQGDPSILQRTYDFYKNDAPFEQDLQPTMPGTQAMIDFLGSTSDPAVSGTQADQYWDTSLLAELPPQ